MNGTLPSLSRRQSDQHNQIPFEVVCTAMQASKTEAGGWWTDMRSGRRVEIGTRTSVRLYVYTCGSQVYDVDHVEKYPALLPLTLLLATRPFISIESIALSQTQRWYEDRDHRVLSESALILLRFTKTTALLVSIVYAHPSRNRT